MGQGWPNYLCLVHLLNLINKEVDRIISNKILSKKYNYSKKLAGEVEQEIELPKVFVNKFLKKFFESNIRDFVKQSTGKITKKNYTQKLLGSPSICK